MLSRFTFAALAFAAPLLTACTDQVDDELDVDDATEGDASKADISGGTYTYYFVKPDLRRCASPYCGGVFYQLANATTTRCFDGKKAEWCYAAGQDTSRLGLSEVGVGTYIEQLNNAALSDGSKVLVRAMVSSKD